MPVDARFFTSPQDLTLGSWAERAGAELHGDPNTPVTGVAAANTARAGDVCFYEGRVEDVGTISPETTACVTSEALAAHLPEGVAALVCDAPRRTHAKVAGELYQVRSFVDSDDPLLAAPDIHPDARLADGVVVGAGAAIGEGSQIGPGCAIGPGVQIGRHARIGAHVSIMCALIGDHVSLASGVRIGEAGFGVLAGPEGAEDIPQFGRVILQDHVTIGANSTIDRGAFDDTIIGERSKIDNLCHVGHNVVIGRNVAMAAYGGISGSCWIGDGARLGGRVGLADHVRVGAGASLAASAGVFRDIPDGETWGGTPAKPLREYMREIAWLAKQTKARNKS